MDNDIFAGGAMVLVFIAVLIVTPLLVILALNTLGITDAAYSFGNWVAAAFLTSLLLGGGS